MDCQLNTEGYENRNEKKYRDVKTKKLGKLNKILLKCLISRVKVAEERIMEFQKSGENLQINKRWKLIFKISEQRWRNCSK